MKDTSRFELDPLIEHTKNYRKKSRSGLQKKMEWNMGAHEHDNLEENFERCVPDETFMKKKITFILKNVAEMSCRN